MGIGIFKHSSCDCCNDVVRERIVEKIVEKRVYSPNPDPNWFEIVEVEEIGKCVLAIVKYPSCTNFEGLKIMVYKDVKISEILFAKFLDPHFCDNYKHIAPIARFVPTDEGIKMAKQFCKGSC